MEEEGRGRSLCDGREGRKGGEKGKGRVGLRFCLFVQFNN